MFGPKLRTSSNKRSLGARHDHLKVRLSDLSWVLCSSGMTQLEAEDVQTISFKAL